MNVIEIRAYGLLEKMLQQAEANNSPEIFNLNREYEQVHQLLSSESRFSYDLCRQSCILGFTLLPLEKERLLQDARARFTELAVPEGYRSY